MRGVYQSERTNCVAACVASVFERDLDEVPDFNPECWYEELGEWLAERGMAAVNIRMNAECMDDPVPAGWTLGAVPHLSDCFPDDWKHCVVCFNGRVVWCPVRGVMDGTQRAEEYTLLYMQNPVRLA